MEVIEELIKIYQLEGLSNIGLISSSKNKNLVELYIRIVLEKRITNENKIAKLIYNSNKADPRYRNLKKRVKSKLIEAILLVDKNILGYDSDYKKAYYDCLQALTQVWFLSRKSGFLTSISIIKTMYSTAEKYQFYDILKQYSYLIIKINAINGNSAIVRKESSKYEQFQNEANNEYFAKVTFFNLAVDLVKKSSINISQLEKFENKLRVLEELESNSNEFLFWKFYTKTYFLILSQQSEQLKKHIVEFEQVIEGWANYPPGRINLYAQQKLSVLFQLKQFNQGLICFSNYEKNITHFWYNWINLKKYQFYHALHVDINCAHNSLNDVLNNNYFKTNKNQSISQLWLIHNAYLQFMLQYEKNPKAQSFNLYKFMNEVDIYSKDKAGYNFSIIAIELLFYLLNDDIDKYIDKMTALMSYRLRHLKTKPFRRSNVFAQLLLSIDKYSFNYEKIRTTSAKKYDYLVSLEDRLSVNEWEIVGYDRLWEIALDILSKRK